MKKIALILLGLGVLALGAATVFRILGAAPTVLDSPPGEGRLDQPTDVFTSFFRSWSLGGNESSSKAREEEAFRLGTAAGSELIALEVRRRELEKLITEAQAKVEKIHSEQAAALTNQEMEIVPDGEEFLPEMEEIQSEPPPDMSEEEVAARAGLARLEAEYQEILAQLKPELLTAEKERLAEIALLKGGAARGAQTLLTGWGRPFRLVSPESLSSLANSQPLLFLPSGALTHDIAGGLEAYVKAGGTLVAMAQRSGAQIASLPGRPRGFGWVEVEGAYENSVRVATAHPSTAAADKAEFTAAVDGFFTDLPEGSQVLLRSAATNQPVAVTYPFGQGRVVATTLYTDWETLSQTPSTSEHNFLRDLVAWALAQGRRLYPDLTEPRAVTKITLPIVNDTAEMAKKVLVCYVTPNGTQGTPFSLDLRMLPEEKQDKVVSLYAPRTPGVWRLTYALVRADGTMLQYWRNAVDWAVGKPAVAAAPTGFSAALVGDGEVVSAGRDISLTLYLWNHEPSELEIEYTGPAGQGRVTVAAEGGRRVGLKLPVAQEAAARGYYEITLTGPSGRLQVRKLLTTVPAAGREGTQ